MKASKLIASGFIAWCCVLAQADTFYWKGGKTWKSFGETTSWDQTTFVSGSDTGNATRLPGAGDDLSMACNAYLDLDGETRTVATFKSMTAQSGGNNYSLYDYRFTNGTLTVNGLWQVRYSNFKIFDGAKLRIKQAYLCNIVDAAEALEVWPGGTVEYFDDYVAYSLNHTVKAGGTYILDPTVGKARVAPYATAVLVNEGTLKLPKTITWTSFAAGSDLTKPVRSFTLCQNGGTLEMSGSYNWEENTKGETFAGNGFFVLGGGTVKVSGPVSFSRVNCSVADDARVTVEIATANASFDFAPFTWGANAQVALRVAEGAQFDATTLSLGAGGAVAKTGPGALKTTLPLPTGLSVPEPCPIVLPEAMTTSAALKYLPQGSVVTFGQLGNRIDSAEDVQGLDFAVGRALADADDLVISDDPAALAFVCEKLQAKMAAGDAVGIVGNRIRYWANAIPLAVTSGTAGISAALAAYNAMYGTSYSTDDLGANLGSVSIVKTGAGQLDFDVSLSNFTGRILVEEGVARASCFWALGQGGTKGAEAGNTRVRDGATLVMDVTDSMPAGDAKAIEFETIFTEGSGADGLGAHRIRYTRSDSREDMIPWAMGHYPILTGDTLVRLETTHIAGLVWSPQPDAELRLNEHTLSLVGAGSETDLPAGAFLLNATKVFNGNITCTNVDLQLQYQPGFQGSGDYRLTIGENASLCYKGGPNGIKTDWTLAFEEGNRGLKIGTQLVTWDENATNDNYWAGPVLLNGNLNLQNGINENNATRGCNLTLRGKVSGKGGIRPTPYNPNLTSKQGINFHLTNPENDFEGGLVASGGQVVLHAATAMPENGGKLILTNSILCLSAPAGADDYRLPDAEFVGACTNRNGHGAFKNVVKEGAGTLAWFSGAGAASLTVCEGSVALAAADSDAYSDVATVAPAFGKMSFAPWTQFNLNGRDYTMSDLGGVPAVLGGNLTVTGKWTLSADEVRSEGGRMTVDGQLTFGAEAVLDLSPGFRRGVNPIVTATGGIVGLPTLSQASVEQGWRLLPSPDGKSLSIVRQGMILMIK